MAARYPAKIKSLPLYDGRFDAHKLTAEDCDVLFASYPAGSKIPPHSHETENHGVITRGELLLTMAGETRRIGSGEWYQVPAGIEHAAEFAVDTDEIEFWFKE